MDQRGDAGGGRRLGDIGGALMLDRVEIAAEDADQVDDDVAAVQGAGDGVGLADIGRDELGLAQIAERLHLDRIGEVALGDAHARAACHQRLGDLAPEKAAAAEDGYQIVLHHARPMLFEKGKVRAVSLATSAAR